MQEIILEALKKNQISTYLITERIQEVAELYFIKKELDMRRRSSSRVFEVEIYHDFNEGEKNFRGVSIVNIFPDMSPEEVEKSLADGYFAAGFVKNPYYELPSGTKEAFVVSPSNLSSMTLEEIIDGYVDALYVADDREDSFINSAEFFVNRHQISIYTSQGIDVSYEVTHVKGEFVTQCLQPQDVEQYVDFAYDEYSPQALTTQVAEALEQVVNRANAVTPCKSGNYDLILSGKSMNTLLSLYKGRASMGQIYSGYSKYEVGMNVQGEDVVGEKLNITLKATAPYSADGIPMKDLTLLDQGQLKNLHGNVRFAYYLKKKPTGNYTSMEVDNGTMSFEDMKKTPYLHVVNFSDFQMNVMSGHFGGEIRLAYYFDGEKVTTVTGGSINGNLLELHKDLVFSTEKYQDVKYHGPMAVKLKNVPVAGEN